MLSGNRFTTRTLTALGVAALALSGVLQFFIDRTGLSTDITDFLRGMLFGMLLGAGIGLLMLMVWRRGGDRTGCAR